MKILLIFVVALYLVKTNAEVELWQEFRTTWSMDPYDEDAFAQMPLTKEEAIDEGFEPMEKNENNFKGHRFMKGNDSANILIYDKTGRFVGFQAQWPKNEIAEDFIFWFEKNDFVQVERDGQVYYATTTYTVDPEKICSDDEEDQCSQPAGCGFWHQIGQNADKENILKIPDTIDEMSDEWIRCKCLPRMGRHYIMNVNKNMDCKDFPSIFVLYIEGKLSGFINLALSPFKFSPRVEHPPNNANLFFYEYPECLPESFEAAGGITSFHHYINEKPDQFVCPPEDQ